MNGIFADRKDAGRALAKVLSERGDVADAVVLALPRGGLPVALEITRALRAPLDVMVVRKLGLPQQPELAMGAVVSGGFRVLNDEVLQKLPVAEHGAPGVTTAEGGQDLHRYLLERGWAIPGIREGSPGGRGGSCQKRRNRTGGLERRQGSFPVSPPRPGRG